MNIASGRRERIQKCVLLLTDFASLVAMILRHNLWVMYDLRLWRIDLLDAGKYTNLDP